MNEVTQAKMAGILFALNWDTHVELPDTDISWLAGELAKALSSKKRDQCGNCGQFAIVIVPTQIGGICEDCIEMIGRAAQEVRTALETRHG